MRAIDADKLKRKAQKVGTEAWKMKLTSPIEMTLNQFIDWIEAEPTIDIPTWIPCSERMPDKNGWYLLAQAYEWGIEYECGVWEDGTWWINDNSHVTVAWKPIEPYKEGE